MGQLVTLVCAGLSMSNPHYIFTSRRSVNRPIGHGKKIIIGIGKPHVCRAASFNLWDQRVDILLREVVPPRKSSQFNCTGAGHLGGSGGRAGLKTLWRHFNVGDGQAGRAELSGAVCDFSASRCRLARRTRIRHRARPIA